MEKVIKIILAVIFFLCLANMPYGYYQFVRFIAMVGFAVLAFQASKFENKTAVIIYGALALLFQPFSKIALGRELWNIIDVIIGIALIVSLFISKPKAKE